MTTTSTLARQLVNYSISQRKRGEKKTRDTATSLSTCCTSMLDVKKTCCFHILLPPHPSFLSLLHPPLSPPCPLSLTSYSPLQSERPSLEITRKSEGVCVCVCVCGTQGLVFIFLLSPPTPMLLPPRQGQHDLETWFIISMFM